MAQPTSIAIYASRIDEITADLARIEAKLEEVRQVVRQVVRDQHGGSQQSLNLPQKSSKDMMNISAADKNSSQDNLANTSLEGDGIPSGKEKACVETDITSAGSDRASSKVAQVAKTDSRDCVIALLTRLLSSCPGMNKVAAKWLASLETDPEESTSSPACNGASGRVAAKVNTTTMRKSEDKRSGRWLTGRFVWGRFWKVHSEHSETKKRWSKELT
ncbi:hypothetical protein MMC17_010016 [Xylographa soralifera]|nr:hypothetical protein [Xylographa soralifera]